MNETTTPTPKTPAGPSRLNAEKTAWWVTFGVLALGIVLMLGAWN
jgi:hypothetical protein